MFQVLGSICHKRVNLQEFSESIISIPSLSLGSFDNFRTTHTSYMTYMINSLIAHLSLKVSSHTLFEKTLFLLSFGEIWNIELIGAYHINSKMFRDDIHQSVEERKNHCLKILSLLRNVIVFLDSPLPFIRRRNDVDA